MHKLPRWSWLLVVSLIIITALITVQPFRSAPSHAQAGGTTIGVPRVGQNALEFIGHIEQTGFTVNVYGYLTNVAGISPEMLFATGINPFFRDQASARITFTLTGGGTSRNQYEGIFVNTASGVLTLYYSETPVAASFEDPASFSRGTPIATFDLNLQTILNVQEPNVGVLYAPVDATQTSATAFTIDGATYTLGQSGLLYHMVLFGQGFRASEEPLAASYHFGGNAVLLP